MNDLKILEKTKFFNSQNFLCDILELNQKIDEEEPILLCEFAFPETQINQISQDEKNNQIENNKNPQIKNPIKEILEKLIKSKENLNSQSKHTIFEIKEDVKKNCENQNKKIYENKEKIQNSSNDFDQEAYENFLKNRTNYPSLKEKILDLKIDHKESNFSKKKFFLQKDFSIFSSDDELFQSNFFSGIILFLKPILNFEMSTLDSGSKINFDLFEYIKLYLIENLEFISKILAIEFFNYIEKIKNDKQNNKFKEFAPDFSEKILSSEDYKNFAKESREKFENLTNIHFKFFEQNIGFLNVFIKNTIFFILNLNFYQNLKNKDENNLQTKEIQNFLKKFFKKILCSETQNLSFLKNFTN